MKRKGKKETEEIDFNHDFLKRNIAIGACEQIL